VVFTCPSALTEDAVEGAALGTADVVETTLVEATAGAAVAVGGRSLLSNRSPGTGLVVFDFSSKWVLNCNAAALRHARR